jgi:nucleotide-binding universal stress UspA family protein
MRLVNPGGVGSGIPEESLEQAPIPSTSAMKTPPPPLPPKSASRPAGAKNLPVPPLKIKKILVPVDFSAAGKPALAYARSLAQLMGASVCLVHVMERVYSIGSPFGGEEFTYIQLDTAKMREHVRRELIKLETGIFRDIETHFEIREGSAYREIIDAARGFKADLIVLATHGYTGLRHVVLGSTTERVVRHAGCPVLVVHSWSGKGVKARQSIRSPG